MTSLIKIKTILDTDFNRIPNLRLSNDSAYAFSAGNVQMDSTIKYLYNRFSQ